MQGSIDMKPLLTIPKVAAILNVCRATVYNLIYEEGLPVIKIGRSVRVSPEALKNWLKERETTLTVA